MVTKMDTMFVSELDGSWLAPCEYHNAVQALRVHLLLTSVWIRLQTSSTFNKLKRLRNNNPVTHENVKVVIHLGTRRDKHRGPIAETQFP